MKRLASAVGLIFVSALLPAPAAFADHLCVGPAAGCYAEIQPAIDAASNGDRITVAPGTYDGDLTVDVSIVLAGAGADQTIIRGGGPVLTIGTFGAPSEPTVRIRGVAITGGVTRSSPESVPFTGEEGVFAAGGGVQIPPNADFSGGADVTIRDSEIRGNEVAPTHALPFGPPCPGGDPCGFAQAEGGGIDSWGTLTLVDTVVRDNRVGAASGLSAVASDADGGGIAARIGALTLRRSAVESNQATAIGPDGRFSEGGGIFADGSALSIRESSVRGNVARLAAALPNSVEQLAVGGGVQIGGSVESAVVERASFAGNSVAATNGAGDAIAFSGGINVADPHLSMVLKDTTVARNEVIAHALDPAGGDAAGDTGGAALAGRIVRTRLADNTVTARSEGGDATAAAGAAILRGKVRAGDAVGNEVHARSPNGSALAAGGAVVVDRVLTMRRTTVRANTASASGERGRSQGGGIFDAQLFSDLEGGRLTLIDSAVLQNVATGPPGMRLQGGGIYIEDERSILINSSVEQNAPDQCFGC
jgi:hypothetical protein